MVQPVVVPEQGPIVTWNVVTWIGENWLPANLAAFPEAAADVTTVNPSGTPQAFALSFADVNRLSGTGLGFPNPRQRAGVNDSWWWTRTIASHSAAWRVSSVFDYVPYVRSTDHGGNRPAIIIHQ